MNIIKKIKGTTFVFLATYLSYTSIYISRLNLSIGAPELTSQGILTTAEIGFLGSIFSVVFAIGRLLNGILNDKVMPWIMLCTGLVAVGLSNVLSGFLMSFIIMAVLWGINAYAQSMLWGSVLRVTSSVYSPEKVGKRTAIMVSSVAVGNILGILINTWIIGALGIKFAYIIPGALNIIMCPITYIALRKIPFTPTEEKRRILPIDLLKRKGVKRVLVPALFHGVMKDNISLWMAAYFVTDFAIDLKKSAWFLLFIPAIGLIGRMGYSIVYQICGKNEHRVSFFGFIVCIVASAILVMPFSLPIVSMLCLGIIYAAVSIINTSMLSIYPLTFSKEGKIATVSGLMDFATYLGAGIGSAIYGIIIANFGYFTMFLSWIIISALSLIILPRQK